MKQYLQANEFIDSEHPGIRRQALEIAAGAIKRNEIVQRCFEWVRDNVRHSGDYQDDEITCRASDVLNAGTGYCFAKSHLLTALLRVQQIPAGLCYQRLSRDDNGAPFCLHGLNAVYLEEYGWYRIDPRGNRPGIDAQFCPPREQLAYALKFEGEADLPEIWAEPLPMVVEVLLNYGSCKGVWENLPDIELINP